jgi:hypothetical protein
VVCAPAGEVSEDLLANSADVISLRKLLHRLMDKAVAFIGSSRM